MTNSAPCTRKNLTFFSCFFLFLLIGSAQTKTEQLQTLLNQYHDYGYFNGSALVAEQGEAIYKGGAGQANMEWDIPNQADTKHRLGSITKQFTAALILQLAEEGKIDLHAPVTTYLPDYPEGTGSTITTHHLLTHSSGIPNYTAFPDFFEGMSRDPFTPEEFVKVFADSTLQFTPGEQFAYSNSGYFLLGVLVEKITGKSYEKNLEEKILEPLGMEDTGFDLHKTILKNRATGYEKGDGGYVNAPYLDMSIPYAAGSLYSTAEDLHKWDLALYENRVLSEKYTKLMFKPQVAAGSGHYAYGWFVRKMPVGISGDSVEVIEHGGGINGFNTLIVREPDNQNLVVLLNNTGGAPLNNITQSMLAILHDKPYEAPKRSLAYSLKDWIAQDGLEAALQQYEQLKESDDYKRSENEMNMIGYQLLSRGETEAAAAVFELNIAAHPESFNVYDSYAEAMMEMGENDKAIENYKKSVEMNPGNTNGIKMLQKLGVKTEELVKEVSISAEVLQSYEGKYALAPNFILTVTKHGEQLKAQATGQPQFDIFPKSQTEFYLKVVPAQITFNRDEQGNVSSLTLYQNGQVINGPRLPEEE
ncbi:serine hydrolase [Zeaxanthinibacter sp. PT1]|uniref:serine hydrolase n=1 Tax=Zeaxanthinibacter TaxID=561554 RepID=UPI0023490852|nr:serine hydrolase [Zeaxanthinibacter sp. PT1]MDC6350456.1 serine hydrolase [Zeaxanthinibacter sp. PT1]